MTKKASGFLFALCLAAFFFGRPFPASAEIVFRNPEYSPSSAETARKALSRLADDPRLSGHPVRRYLYEGGGPATIVFYHSGFGEEAKVVNHNEIHIKSEKDFTFYLRILAHEFVHIGMVDKYGDTCNFAFLPPEDYAFLNLMEEAFANALESWVYLGYPEIPKDYQIRRSHAQVENAKIANAMRNDFRAHYPRYDEERLIHMAAGEMFNLFMTGKGAYTLAEIPRNMYIAYGQRNTVLIPEYGAYRSRSDALLRHVWNYLASIMPFPLPGRMTYDYYRSMFMNWVTLWNAYAGSREASIYYWIKYDAAGAARARLAAQGENEKIYDYLPVKDEERLNRVMKEIDPGFTATRAPPPRLP